MGGTVQQLHWSQSSASTTWQFWGKKREHVELWLKLPFQFIKAMASRYGNEMVQILHTQPMIMKHVATAHEAARSTYASFIFSSPLLMWALDFMVLIFSPILQGKRKRGQIKQKLLLVLRLLVFLRTCSVALLRSVYQAWVIFPFSLFLKTKRWVLHIFLDVKSPRILGAFPVGNFAILLFYISVICMPH